MFIDTKFLERCITTLDRSNTLLLAADPEHILYDIYRSACVKEFELILEQSGKLLKKALKPYFHSSKAVDQLYFKDAFRHGALHSIVTTEECERWLQYRDNRNDTAHDYGVDFAEKTLVLLPQFIVDATSLIQALQKQNTTGDAD